MRPTDFLYKRPTSTSEAIEMLTADGDVKALAGGHSLIPTMNLRLAQPECLVDIGRLDDLHGIQVNGDSLKIGALTTHAEIAASLEVRTHCPALASAAAQIGDPQVRNWGTLGGNLAHADPASDPPPVILACEGQVLTRGPAGERSIDAGDFFIDLMKTDLHKGELITHVLLPSRRRWNCAYAKLSHPASRYAILGVCVAIEVNEGKCSVARVAVGGATPKALRAFAAERALENSPLDPATLSNAADALADDLGDEILGDIFAPADYRRAMTGVYLKKAIVAAVGPAGL